MTKSANNIFTECLPIRRSIGCLVDSPCGHLRAGAYRNLHPGGAIGLHTKSSPTGPAEHDEGGSLPRIEKVSINLYQGIHYPAEDLKLFCAISDDVSSRATVGGLRSNDMDKTPRRRSQTAQRSAASPTMRRPGESQLCMCNEGTTATTKF